MSFCKLSNDTLVSAVSVLVKKIFTKNRSDVHYFLTDFRNRIYAFLCKNQYIETKGFWTGISGTIEHTELMSHLINHAGQKQRSLVVTLIDLKNAFGEVHLELIRAVLRFHHIPRSIEKFILHLYDGFHISVTANGFLTDPILIQRGVLQGNCLSPLMFNMCFNPLITTIDQEKV